MGRSSGAGHAHRAAQEVAHRLDALALGRAHERDGGAELLGERRGVHGAAARLELVGHVQDDERREAQGEDGRREHEVPLEVRRVENEEDRVGPRLPCHLAREDVARHALVLGARRQAVDAGQVDEDDLACPRRGGRGPRRSSTVTPG